RIDWWWTPGRATYVTRYLLNYAWVRNVSDNALGPSCRMLKYLRYDICL
ncbi:MAG: hypothetical protein ACI9HA_000064, partial [Dinoroseobacter sp.]